MKDNVAQNKKSITMAKVKNTGNLNDKVKGWILHTLTQRKKERQAGGDLTFTKDDELQRKKLMLQSVQWCNMRTVYQQLQTFAQHNAWPIVDENTATAWLTIKLRDGCKGSYVQQLAKVIRQIYIRLGSTDPKLQMISMFTAGVRKDIQVLKEESDAAIPMCQKAATMIISQSPTDIATGIWIATKTASRWEDLSELNRTELTYISPTETLVNFKVTKPREKSRIDHLQIITADAVSTSNFRQFMRCNTRPFAKISTQKIENHLKKFEVLSEDLLRRGETKHMHYTAHSMKHGAMATALELRVRGVITDEMLSAFAKHKNKNTISPTTAGYLWTQKVMLARLNKSEVISGHIEIPLRYDQNEYASGQDHTSDDQQKSKSSGHYMHQKFPWHTHS